MIWFLPIERLPQRYTAQMYHWVLAYGAEGGHEIRVVMPAGGVEAAPPAGHFLNLSASTKFKLEQLAAAVEHVNSGEVKDGDVLLIGDLWMPGLEALRFAAEARGIHVTIAGWHYAGMFDPEDALHRHVGAWAFAWEAHLLANVVDFVCVGSLFHADLIAAGVRTHMGLGASLRVKDKLMPYGLCWSPDAVRACVAGQIPTERDPRAFPAGKPRVAFPHRVAREKDPVMFARLAAELCNEAEFVVLTPTPLDDAAIALLPDNVEVHVMQSKKDYYEQLARCTVMFSSAKQETFGYALHESIALGLSVVAPARCSYVEGLQGDKRFLYDPPCYATARDLLRKRIADPISVPYHYTSAYAGSTKRFLADITSRK